MKLKKLLSALGIALALFAVITGPTQAAGGVQEVLAWLHNAAESIITFVKTVV